MWNKQPRCCKASDVIKDNIGFLLPVPTVTQWNSVYEAVGRLIAIFDNGDNLKAFNRACTILTLPLFTNNDIAFLKEYHGVMRLSAQLWISCKVKNMRTQEFFGPHSS